jgi:hypothetical protein
LAGGDPDTEPRRRALVPGASTSEGRGIVTATESPAGTQPVDAIAERLNDPAVAASLVTLLDNAELLSTLVLGLSGVVARSEFIMDSVAEGVNDMRRASGDQPGPSLAELRTVAAEFAEAAPALREILNSSMLTTETISLLSLLSESATEGAAAAARARRTSTLGLLMALRNDDVQRGVNMFVEISRALGRRLDDGNG